MQISRQLGERYTYRPGDVPNPQDWQASESYRRAENVSQTAGHAGDFFQGADNGPNDIDSREGYVRLKEVKAPKLLESTTTTVTGFRTPDGDLQVIGNNQGHEPTWLTVSNNGREISLDRPVYLNNRYLPTLESLTHNQDGSNTFEVAYYTPNG